MGPYPNRRAGDCRRGFSAADIGGTTLDIGLSSHDTRPVTGAKLPRHLRELARRCKLGFRFDPRRGRGDHGTVYFGGRQSLLPGRGELKTGTLHGILRDLGLRLDDLRK